MSGVTDPIADMLTRVRNAGMARHDSVLVPLSKTKQAMADILKDEGFIRDVDTVRSGPWRVLRLRLLYTGTQPDCYPRAETGEPPGPSCLCGPRRYPAGVWWARRRHPLYVTGGDDRADCQEPGHWRRSSLLRLVGNSEL